VNKISKDLNAKIREQAKHRCEYCLVPQKLLSYKLEIEHLLPRGKGGKSVEENLWLACRQCNLSKGIKTHGFDSVTYKRVKLFNPREQSWSEHFVWSDDQTSIIGKTTFGRATVSALLLNNDWQRTAREFWKLTGIFPPTD
jgi:hypothetical protein